MTWACRLIENPELDQHGNVDTSKREVGDMWFLDLPEEELRERHLTAYYWANNSHRKPLVVMLPRSDYPNGKLYFLMDGQCFSAERGHYDGWTVTGIPPLMTVTPSIHFPGCYHGFLGSQGVPPGVIGDFI